MKKCWKIGKNYSKKYKIFIGIMILEPRNDLSDYLHSIYFTITEVNKKDKARLYHILKAAKGLRLKAKEGHNLYFNQKQFGIQEDYSDYKIFKKKIYSK